jgi:hypothetical protein
MGNQISSQQEKTTDSTLKPKSPYQIIDYIATNYILTMDFESLKKLYDKEYCDKLVILTSDIVDRYFTDLELAYLAQRIKNGIEVNEITNDKFVFFEKDKLTNLDIQNSIKKKRVCQSISKFYIKIAHLFACIVTTINPVYVYKDSSGNIQHATLSEKHLIPEGVPREILRLNICDTRIDALKRGNKPTEINPKICTMNLNNYGELKNLSDEPGIPELYQLYLDDKYDFETGEFTSMSETNKKSFQNDLKLFYQVFTGQNDIPEEVTKFSDIKLRNWNSKEQCKGPNPVFETKVSGSDKLFMDYANNIKNMIHAVNKGQESLLSILNEIFVYTIDPQTNKKEIRINPKLTEDYLQNLVIKTRNIIVKLYLTCEVDYANGIKIYEAIIEKKILETSQNQIINLQKMADSLAVNDIPEKTENEIQIEEKQKQDLEKEKNILEQKQEDIENKLKQTDSDALNKSIAPKL